MADAEINVHMDRADWPASIPKCDFMVTSLMYQFQEDRINSFKVMDDNVRTNEVVVEQSKVILDAMPNSLAGFKWLDLYRLNCLVC